MAVLVIWAPYWVWSDMCRAVLEKPGRPLHGPHPHLKGVEGSGSAVGDLGFVMVLVSKGPYG